MFDQLPYNILCYAVIVLNQCNCYSFVSVIVVISSVKVVRQLVAFVVQGSYTSFPVLIHFLCNKDLAWFSFISRIFLLCSS